MCAGGGGTHCRPLSPPATVRLGGALISRIPKAPRPTRSARRGIWDFPTTGPAHPARASHCPRHVGSAASRRRLPVALEDRLLRGNHPRPDLDGRELLRMRLLMHHHHGDVLLLLHHHHVLLRYRHARLHQPGVRHAARLHHHALRRQHAHAGNPSGIQPEFWETEPGELFFDRKA